MTKRSVTVSDADGTSLLVVLDEVQAMTRVGPTVYFHLKGRSEPIKALFDNATLAAKLFDLTYADSDNTSAS